MHDCLGDCLASCLTLPYMRHVQKQNQLQTLADAALQSQSDQDVEHKYDDKDKVRVLYAATNV
jgi:hypothetical protein